MQRSASSRLEFDSHGLVLENKHLRVEVAPDEGARILSFFDKRAHDEWVWRDPAKQVSFPLPVGSSFDQNWNGGWQDVFPNDAAQTFLGREWPDHGEVWGQPWQVLENSAHHILLRYPCKTVPVEITKKLVLDADEGVLSISYLYRNLANADVPFLFKFHPALTINEGDEIKMPDCSIEPVALGFSSMLGQDEKSHFPYGRDKSGHIVAINKALAVDSQQREFVYASDLGDGWCGIKRNQRQNELRFYFDKFYLPFVWIFQSYGGFMGKQVVMLEPCTTMPYDLNIALEKGTTPRLEPGQSREYDIKVAVL